MTPGISCTVRRLSYDGAGGCSLIVRTANRYQIRRTFPEFYSYVIQVCWQRFWSHTRCLHPAGNLGVNSGLPRALPPAGSIRERGRMYFVVFLPERKPAAGQTYPAVSAGDAIPQSFRHAGRIRFVENKQTAGNQRA